MARGQIMVFENVLVFAISITIFIFCFIIFLNLQDYYSSVGIHDQMNKVQNIIATAMVTAATTSEANCSIIVDVPKTIAGEFYEIRLDSASVSAPGTLVVRLKSVEKTSSVFGLGCCSVVCPDGCFSFSGRVLSKKGKVTVYKSGGQINIL